MKKKPVSEEIKQLQRIHAEIKMSQTAFVEQVHLTMQKNQNYMTGWLMLVMRDLRQIRSHFTPERKEPLLPKGSPSRRKAMLDELTRNRGTLDGLRLEKELIDELFGLGAAQGESSRDESDENDAKS